MISINHGYLEKVVIWREPRACGHGAAKALTGQLTAEGLLYSLGSQVDVCGRSAGDGLAHHHMGLCYTILFLSQTKAKQFHFFGFFIPKHFLPKFESNYNFDGRGYCLIQLIYYLCQNSKFLKLLSALLKYNYKIILWILKVAFIFKFNTTFSTWGPIS